MLAYVAAVLALAAAAINLGWLPLPTGHWPGISLGLAAALAGLLELRDKPARPALRILAWCGAGLGLAAALLGILVYIGWGIAAHRLS
jgi:hypothetical protein